MKDKIKYLIDHLLDIGCVEIFNEYFALTITGFNYITTLVKEDCKIDLYHCPDYINVTLNINRELFYPNKENYLTIIKSDYNGLLSSYQGVDSWAIFNEDNGKYKIDNILKEVLIFKSYFRNIKIDKLLEL